MTPAQTPFQAGWWGTDLGQYRACEATYCFFEYERLPPLDDTLLRGEFQWLTPLSAATAAEMERHHYDYIQATITRALPPLTQSLAAVNLHLPPAFVRFMQRPDWQALIPSCTANFFLLLSQLVSSPFGDGGYCINFLSDQRGVLLWYLYLAPTGEHCVLVAADDITRVAQDEVWFCAPSFEAFLYRYWLENRIWFALDEAAALTPAEQAYVAHYTQG